MRIQSEQKKSHPSCERGTGPRIAGREQEKACSDETGDAEEASSGAASPERIDRSQWRNQNVRQRKPNSAELAQAGGKVVEQAASFVDVCYCVDVNEGLVTRKEIKERIDNNDRRNDADQDAIPALLLDHAIDFTVPGL